MPQQPQDLLRPEMGTAAVWDSPKHPSPKVHHRARSSICRFPRYQSHSFCGKFSLRSVSAKLPSSQEAELPPSYQASTSPALTRPLGLSYLLLATLSAQKEPGPLGSEAKSPLLPIAGAPGPKPAPTHTPASHRLPRTS